MFLWLEGGGGGGGGAGADFFQQLKLDFFIVKVFFVSTIAIRPYTLVKLLFHQISRYLISILNVSHNNELII